MNEPLDKPTSSNEHTSNISRLCACETCVAARNEQRESSQQPSSDKPARKGKGRPLAATAAVVALIAVIVGAFLLWPESTSSTVEDESEVAQTIASDDADPKAAAALEVFVSYLQNSDSGSGGGTSAVKAALAAFVERGVAGETVAETEDASVLIDAEAESELEPANSCALAAPLSSRLITP
ncbi:MAG: hypothetical protein P8R36_03570, partial [Actinomycetota bacterium]|nr:hypothetical protein [Actinomycetota bacterium]